MPLSPQSVVERGAGSPLTALRFLVCRREWAQRALRPRRWRRQSVQVGLGFGYGFAGCRLVAGGRSTGGAAAAARVTAASGAVRGSISSGDAALSASAEPSSVWSECWGGSEVGSSPRLLGVRNISGNGLAGDRLVLVHWINGHRAQRLALPGDHARQGVELYADVVRPVAGVLG